MSQHNFDPEIAAIVGVNAAVIYQNIAFWCEKNAANDRNIFEGRAWTYNTTKAFSILFPYLTADQIRRALEKLEYENLIGVGAFNSDPRDRTKWYCDIRQLHLAKLPVPFGENPKALPDNKPDTKQDLFDGVEAEADGAKIPASEAIDSSFEKFWAAYPEGRKTDKPKAKAVFVRIVTGKSKELPKTSPEVIIEAAHRYRATQPDPKFVPLPKTWLNGARWNDKISTQSETNSNFWTGNKVFR